MTESERKRLEEIRKTIAALQEEKQKIVSKYNPYFNLKSYSNKKFGEEWAEQYVHSMCPSLEMNRGKGYDFVCHLGKVELKSSRLPLKQITYNQCHPQDCDYFLFINFNTETGEEEIYLVPSSHFNRLHYSQQHSRNDESCYSISGTNRSPPRPYLIADWAALEAYARGEING